MSFDAETLYALLPAVYRTRDAENGHVLRSLVGLLAGQIGLLEEDLRQLYDNQFIETCAPWAIPYVGEAIGWKPLGGSVPGVASPRAEVANTIALRRHKGTAAMLEVLAREVTGWPARAVEFFELLSTTQFMNHLRPQITTPDLRRGIELERLGSALERIPHSADVRRIPPGRGRYNIPNVGLFLWRLEACPRSRMSAFPVEPGLRYTFSPLGANTPLFTLPQGVAAIDEFTRKAGRLQLPIPLTRRVAARHLADYYGTGRSFQVWVDGQDVGVSPADPTKTLDDLVSICDLGDVLDVHGNPTGAWAHSPPSGGKISIDPVLGRIAFPSPVQNVTASHHYGFAAHLGGGEYDRRSSVDAWLLPGTRPVDFQRGVTTDPDVLAQAADPTLLVPTIADALNQWNAFTAGRPGGFGVIALMDPLVSDEALDLEIPEGFELAIVAADWPQTATPALVRTPGVLDPNGLWPLLRGDLTVTGTAPPGSATPGSLVLDGLQLSGTLRVKPGPLKSVLLSHCTVVPWTNLGPDRKPLPTSSPRIIVEEPLVALVLRQSIAGAVRCPRAASFALSDGVLDATSETGIAFAAPDGIGFGGSVSLARCTVRGRLKTARVESISDSVLLAELPGADPAWPAAVLADERQSGCVRYCVLPPESLVPRRFRCQPDLALAELARELQLASVEDLDPELAAARRAQLVPQFTSLVYGDPAYAQLSARTAREIREGADDRSEMGAFHDVFQPQRLSNLRRRLDEYLRFGLEAGTILST